MFTSFPGIVGLRIMGSMMCCSTLKNNVAFVILSFLLTASNYDTLYRFQHEAGRAAYEDAQEQIREIHRRIDTRASSIKDVQSELEKKKLEALDAHGVEQVCLLRLIVFDSSFVTTYVEMLKHFETCRNVLKSKKD